MAGGGGTDTIKIAAQINGDQFNLGRLLSTAAKCPSIFYSTDELHETWLFRGQCTCLKLVISVLLSHKQSTCNKYCIP